jgi:hypothetical protein
MKQRKERKGAAAIEFALILPAFMAILLGIIEFGMYFNERQYLYNILVASCGEDYYNDAEYLFIEKYGVCDGCAVSLLEDDKYYYCSLDKEHDQLTNFFPPTVMPQHMNMEAVTRKDDEEEETGYYY